MSRKLSKHLVAFDSIEPKATKKLGGSTLRQILRRWWTEFRGIDNEFSDEYEWDDTRESDKLSKSRRSQRNTRERAQGFEESDW